MIEYKYRICWQLPPEYGNPIFDTMDAALEALDEAPELYDGYNTWVEAVAMDKEDTDDNR